MALLRSKKYREFDTVCTRVHEHGVNKLGRADLYTKQG